MRPLRPGPNDRWYVDRDEPKHRAERSRSLWTRSRAVLGTAVVSLALSTVAGPVTSPVNAGKPPKNTTTTVASDPSGVQDCSQLTNSLTLGMIRDRLGIDAAKVRWGLDGDGIDVAVIDTGITNVPGLDAPGKVIDGPDLSFDAQHENLRHQDLHGHGTNMASIIGARGGLSGSGMAPGARLIDVKIGAGDGSVDVSQAIAAVDWVVDHRNANGMNIRVINLAYSTNATQSYTVDPLAHAVERAWRAGIVVVAAGGNDGRSAHQLGNPAMDPYIIAVGAAEEGQGNWNVPSWSSTGDGVRNPDFVAPGARVLASAVPGSHLATQYPSAVCTSPASGEGTYLRGNGTSQAAAVTSGAIAVLLQQRPDLTPDQVKALLKTSAIPMNSNGNMTGSGLLSMYRPEKRKAVGALVTPTPDAAAVTQQFSPSTGSGSLHAARGDAIVGTGTDVLTGDLTAFGTRFDATAHAQLGATGATWSGATWSGATWSGGTWNGATWSGATWSGATWSGATWSGATWSGATWSGATWSGATWSGATWSGATWSGATWSGANWS